MIKYTNICKDISHYIFYTSFMSLKIDFHIQNSGKMISLKFVLTDYYCSQTLNCVFLLMSCLCKLKNDLYTHFNGTK